MESIEPVVDVIFRVWNAHPRSVIALFPGIDEGRGDVSSYEHVGQHGSASYAGVVYASRPATPAEYANLKRELESVPYKYRLRVRRRRSR